MTTQTRVTLTAGAATLLGAIPLAGGFAQQRWFWYAMLAVAVVAGIGVLLRTVHAPAPLIVPAQVIGLLVYHTVVFASNRGYGGIVPNGHTLSVLNTQLSDGLHDIQYLSAPVPAQTDIVVLTSLAVGLLAIVVDVIAVSAGRPAVAGLALLALFAVATAVSARTLFFEFAGAGAGYLLLLAVEGRERLVRWGRVVTADDPVGRTSEHQTAVRMPRHSAAGRVGIVAVAAALIIPALVPGFTRNVLSSIGHGTSNGGFGPQSFGSGLNPFTELKGSLQDSQTFDVLKVKANSNVNPYYLRVTVLDDFTSDGWQRGNFHDSVAGVGVNMETPPELASLQQEGHVLKVNATVDVLNYRDNRLPVYYAPTTIQGVGSHWRYDTTRSEILADRGDDTSSGDSYKIQATMPNPTSTELLASKALPAGGSIMKRWGYLPRLPLGVKQITDEIIRGKSGPWNKAFAINNYFTDGTQGFTYNTSTKTGSSGNALLDFLQQKQGFCEQYASAMAVMLRQAGIPSRVVLGYAQGKYDDKSKTWTITNKDAHAWVEGYFANVGWVEFDPTPRGDGDTTPGAVFQQSTSSDPTLPTTGQTGPQSSASGLPQNGPHTDPAGGGGGGGNTTPPSQHGTTTPAVAGLIGAAAFIVAMLFIPTLARRTQRRRRFAVARGRDPSAAAHAAWVELLATAADLGIAFVPAESPRATAARLARGGDMDAAATSGLRVVALAEERARYAAVAGIDGDLPTALRAARSGLLGRASRRRRLRIAAIPPSVVQSMRVAASTGYQRAVASVLSLSQLLRPGRWLPRSHPKS
jgi:transglutaminase-like putative cysteine protease